MVNQDCHALKKNLRNLGNLLTKFPNDTYLRHNFFSKRKEYKSLLKKLKKQFHSSLLDKIEVLADRNPKEYWQLVKSIKTNQNSQMPTTHLQIGEWFEYFKYLNKNVNLCTEGSSTEAQIVKDFNRWAADENYLLDHPISNEEVCRISFCMVIRMTSIIIEEYA